MAGVYVKYGQSSTGVDLYCTDFSPVLAPGQKVPFVIGLHPGGFKAGSAVLQAQGVTCAQNGLYFRGTEYRMAPPHAEMDSAGGPKSTHPIPGQNDVGDEGHSIEMTEDVITAIRAAKAHPSCDGRVYGLGGSAGGYLVLFNMLTAPAADRFDLGVACSPGVFDLYQSQIWAIPNPGNETYPAGAIANYVNIPDTNPLPPTGANLVLAKNASPSFFFDAAKLGGKIWVLVSDHDSPGIPTSIGIELDSWQKDGSAIFLSERAADGHPVTQGFVPRSIAAGMTESTSDVPEAGLTYKKTVVVTDTSDNNNVRHAHAFNYWELYMDGSHLTSDKVSDAVVHWFNGGAVQAGGQPSITSFAPLEGVAGVTAVVITGENIGTANGVRFNHIDALSFTVDSGTQVTAIPPIGGTSGQITVSTPVDVARSQEIFVFTSPILPVPLIPRTPILVYPQGGLAPTPPHAPSAPLNLIVEPQGIPSSHKARATWTSPIDTGGFTLLSYKASVTSAEGFGGDIPDIPGDQTTCDIERLENDIDFKLHLQAHNAIGFSDEAEGGDFHSDPGTAPTPKDEPRGVVTLLQQVKDAPFNGRSKYKLSEVSNYWGNPQCRGSRYRTTWAQIQPTSEAEYNWTEIDEYLALCTTYGQWAGISISAGITCPQWLIDNPNCHFYDVSGPDPGHMVIPWDDVFLEKWINFYGVLSDRYDSHAALRYIALAGFGQVVESVVCKDQVDCDALTVIAQRRFGSIREGWEYAAQRIIGRATTAFKHTRCVVTLVLPVPNSIAVNQGDGDLGCYDIADYGLTRAPDTFGVMNAGLNPDANGVPDESYPPFHIIYLNSPNMTAGFQFVHSSGDIDPLDPEGAFNDCLIAGATLNRAKFIEAYLHDATSSDVAYQADIAAANIVMDANT